MFSSYSGTSLLRSHTGLVKSDLNGEVTSLQGIIYAPVEYNLGLSQCDCNGEVFLIVRARVTVMGRFSY